MKPVFFLGGSRKALRSFPAEVQQKMGFSLFQVQLGVDPRDWKPMPGIGPGVREIRIWDRTGAFRTIYLASLPEAVYVLHFCQKTSQKTEQVDIELARSRLLEIRSQK